MNTLQCPERSTSRKVRGLLALSAAGLLLGGASAATATPITTAPAFAPTGCSVQPLKPVQVSGGKQNENKQISYPVEVSCRDGRTAVITDQPMERDSITGDDDFEPFKKFSATTSTVSHLGWRMDTENGPEEVYHRTKFQVRVNGQLSTESNWVASPELIVRNN
jgi:hypothetical protein